jgi:hypothetical protein
MWECGVALDPKTEDTKIVVFECAGQTPRVFHASVRVNVTKEGIEKFTNQFHTDINFFPKQEAYKSDMGQNIIQELGRNLYKDLSDVIPGSKYKEIPLVHRLKLSLAAESVDKVIKKRNLESYSKETCKTRRKHTNRCNY